MNKKTALVILILCAAAILLLFVSREKREPAPAAGDLGTTTPRTPPALSLDDFAKCLSARGATMYGAYWCPHCEREKGNFGDSFKFVNYVECTVDTKKCAAAGIRGFPTWVFPAGRRFEGEQGLAGLSAESGCPLPETIL